jgi:uncharacterized protein (DUF1800 family)
MKVISRRKFIRSAVITTAAGGLAACVPKENQIPEQLPNNAAASAAATPRPTFPPPQPLEVVPNHQLPPLGWIVFNRLGFGPRPGDLTAFEALGQYDNERLAAYVEAQLNPATLDDAEFDSRFGQAGFETLGKSLEILTEEHIVNNPYDNNDDKYWEWFILPAQEVVDAAFLRATFSRKQLQEVLIDFWHNHFNVYGLQENVTPLLASYDRDVMRAHVFGNFRQLLEAVATHPFMLFYLDNRSNSNAGPNENFARELFELHTLGAENYLGVRDPNSVPKLENGLAIGYVDNDVYEAARCFTGWRVDDDLYDGEEDVGVTGQFLYYRPWHDRYNKFVLGKYLPADQADMQDGRDVLDMLAFHPGTATHLARKLCRRLIADDPPESVVERAAAVFLEKQNDPDQLRQVYRTIITSPEFLSSWGGKIKRPFEWAVGALRAVEADFKRIPGGVRWTYDQMGQPLFGHHPPDGYPDMAPPWANTMSTLYGWNLITGICENWWSDDEKDRPISVDVWAQTPPEIRSANAVVTYWASRLLHDQIPPESRAALVEFVAAQFDPDDDQPDDDLAWRVPAVVALMLKSPQFRLR